MSNDYGKFVQSQMVLEQTTPRQTQIESSFIKCFVIELEKNLDRFSS